MLGRPGQGGIDVGSLRTDEVKALRLPPAAHVGRAPVGAFGVPDGVRLDGLVAKGAFLQPVRGECPDAVEQSIAVGAVITGFDLDQGSSD